MVGSHRADKLSLGDLPPEAIQVQNLQDETGDGSRQG